MRKSQIGWGVKNLSEGRCQLAQTFHPLWLVEKSDGLQKSALAQILHPPMACDESDGMQKLPCAQTLHPPMACDESDGMQKLPCAQTLHPPTAMRRIRWSVKASLCLNPSIRLRPYGISDGAVDKKCHKWAHPFSSSSIFDGAHGKKCLNELHPFWRSTKKDGLCPNE